jgi:hypothetical protein
MIGVRFKGHGFAEILFTQRNKWLPWIALFPRASTPATLSPVHTALTMLDL